jgi:hypothetical protein
LLRVVRTYVPRAFFALVNDGHFSFLLVLVKFRIEYTCGTINCYCCENQKPQPLCYDRLGDCRAI